MKYDKTIDEVAHLVITEDNIATMSMEDMPPAIVQLTSDEEAQKLIKEFEDADGEMCHKPDAVMTMYPQFHAFRP